MLAGAVNIKFMADIMDLQSKMTQAQTSVSGAMGNIEKAVNQAKTALGALGIGLSAGAIVAHVKGIIDAADAMNDLSQRTGIAVKDLAKYELATAQSGTTMEALAKGIKGVSINLLEHGDALKKAGLSATNADAAMMQLADLFKAMPDGMEKTALAVKMFGKSGMDLIPMLNMGSDGLKEAADKSAKYAATMAALAPQADKFNDNLAELGMLIKIAGMSLMNDMLPALLRISQTMIDAKQNGQGFWETMNAGIWAFENEASKHLPGIFESYATAMPRQIANLKKELSDLQSEKGGLKMDLFGVGPKIDADIASTIKALAAAEEAYKKYLLTVNGPAGGDKGGSAVKPNTAIADWKAQYKAMMDAIKDTGGVKEAESEYDKLIKKLGIDVSNAAAAAEAAQNGYNKSQTEFVALKMGEVWAGLTEQQKEVVSKLFASKIASEQLADATKLIAKELEAYAAAQQKTISASYEELSKAQEAYDAHGKLASVIQEEVLARMQNNRQIMGGAGEDTAAITREIENKKKLIAILKSGEARDAGIKAAEDVAKEWQRGWEDTDRIAREAFTGWAENGTSMASSIGKTLKKAMLSAIYEATIKPIAFSIYSSMTGAPASAAGPATSGAFGAFTGTSLAAVGSQIGSAASISMSNGLVSGFGANMANIAGQIEAGSYAAAFGMAVPYVAAAAAIYSLLSQDHGTPTQNTGNASASFDAAGNRTAYQTYFGGSSANTDAMIGNMQLAYLAGAKSLGITAAATNFSYGSNTGKDSQNPMFALSGGSGASNYSQAETAYSDAAVSLAASRAVFAALQGSDLPQYLAKAFNGAVADTMTQDQITNTLNFAASLKQVREALLETREPLQILRDNVASGFATLGTSADTFKTDFVAAIDAGVSPATLAAWQALATTMDQLTTATEAANVALATSKSAVLGASEKVSSVLRAIGNDVKSFADAASTAHDNLVGARLNISEALWSAQDRVIELQRQAADGLRTFAASIDDFLNTINPATSSSASLAMLKAQLSATAVLASGGDTGAQGQLISQAQAVLKAAEASSTDRVQYARSEAFVRSTLATVKKAVDPTPIVDAVAVAIVDPMAVAKAELKAAQDAVVAYTNLAQATGATTDRNTRSAADSVVGLSNAYGAALVANTDAQNNYAEAVRVTAGLQLTVNGTWDSLSKNLTDLDTANATLITESGKLATALGNPKMPADKLAEALGSAGIAATNFKNLLNAATGKTDTVNAPVTAGPITTSGGALTGAQTVSMADAVGALNTVVGTASAAQIVNAANVNLGVSAADMARVGTYSNNADITAAANAAMQNVYGSGGTVAGNAVAAKSYSMAELQAVLTSQSALGYTASQLIGAGMSGYGLSEADIRAAGRSIGLPGYAIGTNYLQKDGPIFAHAGEEITPRPFVDIQRAAREENNALMARLVASNERLEAKVEALQKSNEATAKATEKTADTLNTVTRGGRAIQTEAFI